MYDYHLQCESSINNLLLRHFTIFKQLGYCKRAVILNKFLFAAQKT